MPFSFPFNEHLDCAICEMRASELTVEVGLVSSLEIGCFLSAAIRLAKSEVQLRSCHFIRQEEGGNEMFLE